MLYVPSPAGATAAAPSKPSTTITGAGLRNRNGVHPAFRRAFTAADLAVGRRHLIKPTVRQAAVLCSVSVRYTYAALRAANDPGLRASIEAGCQPLISTANSETLAQHFARTSKEELLECARTVGVDVLWDTLIAPIVA
jgi:hypothetical protein